MFSQTVGVLILVGIILSNQAVVCDVDPTDTNAVLFQQLQIQRDQLALNKLIVEKQSDQIRLQTEQITILQRLIANTNSQPIWLIVLESVSSTIACYYLMRGLKSGFRYLQCLQNPEMPRTQQLNDFAISYDLEAERLRSARIDMKSPTNYLSCESEDE